MTEMKWLMTALLMPVVAISAVAAGCFGSTVKKPVSVCVYPIIPKSPCPGGDCAAFWERQSEYLRDVEQRAARGQVSVEENTAVHRLFDLMTMYDAKVLSVDRYNTFAHDKNRENGVIDSYLPEQPAEMLTSNRQWSQYDLTLAARIMQGRIVQRYASE